MKNYTLSRKVRFWSAFVLVLITLVISGVIIWMRHWLLFLLVLPWLFLLYDVLACRYELTEDTIKVRTGQYPFGRVFYWTDFKDVKVDKFAPWGRVVLLPKSGKKREEVYILCDNPLAFRDELAAHLHRK
ncbi:MAG: hypothetical protein NC038_02165 [Paludibacter sp.]|nr:hypothetical protein [Bacteroidales bacterium]MCM1068480.1 hypothetical protein [Prevotella sp.]MCM1353434.1 hypothetical protein [Bacteroides sp.]MCM1442595.1 hypothetical protein [Muribaculum sp.]MCM1481440.1 hypothetical protein [Paludibacter sp.]